MLKHIILAITAFVLIANVQIFAQRPKEIKDNEVGGIYLNISDFKQGKLTRPTDKQHKGDKIKLKQFFNSPEIKFVEQGKETVFLKDSIFAIRLTKGENYRFINRTPCLVTDTSYLFIYTQKSVQTVYKQAGRSRRAEDIPVTNYYFSSGNHKSVLMLTLANLRKYVLTDTVVHKTVCDKFTADEMLQEVNLKTGRFVLNETIIKTLKR